MTGISNQSIGATREGVAMALSCGVSESEPASCATPADSVVSAERDGPGTRNARASRLDHRPRRMTPPPPPPPPPTRPDSVPAAGGRRDGRLVASIVSVALHLSAAALLVAQGSGPAN